MENEEKILQAIDELLALNLKEDGATCDWHELINVIESIEMLVNNNKSKPKIEIKNAD